MEVGHIAFAFRNQSTRNVHAQLAFSYLSVQDPSLRNAVTHTPLSLPNSEATSQTCPELCLKGYSRFCQVDSQYKLSQTL